MYVLTKVNSTKSLSLLHKAKYLGIYTVALLREKDYHVFLAPWLWFLRQNFIEIPSIFSLQLLTSIYTLMTNKNYQTWTPSFCHPNQLHLPMSIFFSSFTMEEVSLSPKGQFLILYSRKSLIMNFFPCLIIFLPYIIFPSLWDHFDEHTYISSGQF